MLCPKQQWTMVDLLWYLEAHPGFILFPQILLRLLAGFHNDLCSQEARGQACPQKHLALSRPPEPPISVCLTEPPTVDEVQQDSGPRRKCFPPTTAQTRGSPLALMGQHGLPQVLPDPEAQPTCAPPSKNWRFQQHGKRLSPYIPASPGGGSPPPAAKQKPTSAKNIPQKFCTRFRSSRAPFLSPARPQDEDTPLSAVRAFVESFFSESRRAPAYTCLQGLVALRRIPGGNRATVFCARLDVHFLCALCALCALCFFLGGPGLGRGRPQEPRPKQQLHVA